MEIQGRTVMVRPFVRLESTVVMKQRS